ncbi:uncharacterized protein LOC122135804 [Cyprinus carpio]|uniref:Uncharacterized protein LOC122135804 n=1 Tax=Cyprinus carpio TaxID=7962 RepID=A0A9Q9VVK8_CYPCA|nr:uncharacterized protein LOC122135804 [Cyprinus carpio]
MSQQEKREEDTASKISCDQPTKSQPSAFSEAEMTSEPNITRRRRQRSPEPSSVSLKSDTSMKKPPIFSDSAVTSDSLGKMHDTDAISSSSTSHSQTHIRDERTEADLQKHTLETGDLQRVKDQHKTSMKNKYERLFEGTKLQENQTFLNRIFTQLYIIEGESEGVDKEHEVLQMEKTARTKHSQDTAIDCNNIFKVSAEPGCEEKEQIKTVLTKGIAGIGKNRLCAEVHSGLGRGKRPD